MKISNRLFNDQQINQFSKNMQDIQKIQSRISSGKNIIFASEDPVGAVELSGLNDVTGRINQFLNKLNNISIEKKRKIDFKLINEVINSIS